VPVVGEMDPMGQFCFAMEIRGSARHIFGKLGRTNLKDGRKGTSANKLWY